MASTSLSELQYPIGRAELPDGPLTPAERRVFIEQMAALPAELRHAARQAGGVRLEQPYRPAAGRAGRCCTTWPMCT
ncbi:hypothetical protein GCM10027048_05990 [Hymenobacter coalescens]